MADGESEEKEGLGQESGRGGDDAAGLGDDALFASVGGACVVEEWGGKVRRRS